MNPRTLNQAQGDLLPEVFRCLERGGTVVTANARAARALRRAHTSAQLDTGKAAWLTPAIFDWESFQSTLWQQYLAYAPESPLLLSPLQERAVWKRIAGIKAGAPESTAMLAANAWKLLSDYGSHDERRHGWRGRAMVDAERFRGWAAKFERECRRNRWMSRSDLASLLTEALGKSVPSIPKELLLAGFDRLTPAMEREMQAFSATGCAVAAWSAAAPERGMRLVQAKDAEDELATCAWWARRRLEANPAARLAIIVQDIPALRDELERTFRRVLMPGAVGIEGSELPRFEFSLGRSLAGVPVVRATLLLLRWLISPVEQAALSWLLLSGFFAAAGDDLDDMAALDIELREFARLPPEISLDSFARCRPRSFSETSGRFMHRMRELRRRVETERLDQRTGTVPEWIDLATSVLEQLRWPGARVLDSIEFQALDRWNSLLAEIAALGFDGSRVDYREFVTMLERYSAETVFAQQSRDAPMQIMGPLESSGQSFDAIWFLGVDERRWPGAAVVNSLLPLRLQRDARMPHSSAAVDWQFALDMTRRIAASGAECIFSHAQQDDSGALRRSAVLAEAFGASPASCSSSEFQTELEVPAEEPHRRLTISFEDEARVAWPCELQAGGADILKHQSACAFRAFALRRLGAAKLDPPARGIAPKDRGTILHKVLEAIWSKANPEDMRLTDRADLLNARATGRLPAILDHHIAAVFQGRPGTPDESLWSRQYLRIEQTRLRALLLQWLDFEATRQDFSVEERESGFHVDLNGLQLSLRVDRIDRVDGGRIIMDYKTSKVSAGLWEGERPDEPQLPLYGVYGPVDDLRGILFAQLRAGDIAVSGRVEDATVTVTEKLSARSRLVQKPLDEDAKGEWADALSRLADEFLAGEAAVAPKAYPKTCKYCGLQALCRVVESPTVIDEEDDDPEDGESFLPGGNDADD